MAFFGSYPMQFKKKINADGGTWACISYMGLPRAQYYILHDLHAKHCAKLTLHTYSIKFMCTWVRMMMKKKHTIFSSFSQHNSQKTVRVGFEL